MVYGPYLRSAIITLWSFVTDLGFELVVDPVLGIAFVGRMLRLFLSSENEPLIER